MGRFFALCLLCIATPIQAAIDLDLGHVDTTSDAYLRFKAWVDRAVAGNPGYAFSALDAAFMARLEPGNAAYCALAVQRVEAQVQAAEARMTATLRPEVSGDSYLHVGDMIGELAFTYDWCASAITPTQRSRWAAYAEQAVWNVWNPDQAQWNGWSHPWSGWSINDPGNNYYYSFIEAPMSWALASDSLAWRSFLDTVKLPPLTATFAGLVGGGSPEGTGYGTAHMRLFWLYRLWRDATGTDLAAAGPHVDDSILYWAHATVPTRDHYAPIGDQARSSVPEMFDYQRRLMLEARALSNDPARRAIASGWLNTISVERMQQGFNFRHDLLDPGDGLATPATTLHHATGVGHLFVRHDWSPGSLWMSVVAGPFEQSHAHQDQGSFTLFRRDWLTVTQNIWSHSGIQQETPVHNVLRFERNGAVVPQRRGTTSSMTASADGAGWIIDAELGPAYGTTDPLQWNRRLQFAHDRVEVRDSYVVGSDTQAVFQLNLPSAPTIDGRTARTSGLRIDVLEPLDASLSVVHWPDVDADFRNGGWRLDIAGGSGSYRVLLVSGESVFRGGFEAR